MVRERVGKREGGFVFGFQAFVRRFCISHVSMICVPVVVFKSETQLREGGVFGCQEKKGKPDEVSAEIVPCD